MSKTPAANPDKLKLYITVNAINGPIITLHKDKIIEFFNENLNLVRAIPNDIKTKNIVAYVKRNVVFSRNKGVSSLKNKKVTDTIIAYTGGLLIKISKEKLFFAKKTPNVKWNKMITEAMADATPSP